MANTLTNLITDMYVALDVVSRELVGLIPSVSLDAQVANAAIGETVYSFTAPAASASNVTAASVVPDDGDQTFGNKTVAITKARRVPFRWNGEQTKQMSHTFGVLTMRQAQIAQAFRTLTNEIETDLASLNDQASRAYGTAGTAPFASTLADSANLRKILDDNGAPASDRHYVIDTAAGVALRTLTQLTKANEAADSSMLRQGELLDLHGFAIRESAQIEQDLASGTASGATTDSAGYAIGATTITLASAGSGTILAGDVVTFAGDSNKYVVETGDTQTSDGGSIILAEPGMREVIASSAVAITVIAASTRNMAFVRSAIVLATRAPALPDDDDLASDRVMIQDPRSGLAFELAKYPLYRMVKYELSIAWGFGVMKPEHLVISLG